MTSESDYIRQLEFEDACALLRTAFDAGQPLDPEILRSDRLRSYLRFLTKRKEDQLAADKEREKTQEELFPRQK